MIKKYGLLAILFFCQIGFTQLSPGDLHRSHAHLEGLKNCSTCHGIGQGITAIQCLECHQILKEEISQNKGLHSRPEYQECQKCHVEHHGRDFDLIWWENGKENFKHELSGFTLLGNHQKLKCNQCHQEKHITEKTKFTNQGKNLNRTFLGLSQNCLNCHRNTHRGQLSTICLNCHSMEGWKPAPGFNHNKTKFALAGKHKNVQCASCHKEITDNKYEEDKTFLKFAGLLYQACTNCHRDIHQNKFGQNCTRCHNTTGWSNYNSQNFNHSATQYPLQGMHLEVSCEKCHHPGQPMRGLKFANCIDCHEDYHQGRFIKRPGKGDCKECHSVEGFRSVLFTLEEHNKTSFVLEGGHLAIPCNSCHHKINLGTSSEIVKFDFPSTACKDCHTDPHSGTVSKYLAKNGCSACHSLESWKIIKFNHQQTKFPLEFKHTTLPCLSCHKQDKEKMILLRSLPPDCHNCHQDSHYNQFAESREGNSSPTNCKRCHTPRDWKAEKFDHDLHASFKLEGAHENLNCNRCHPIEIKSDMKFTRYKPIPNKCVDCHGKMIKTENDRDA